MPAVTYYVAVPFHRSAEGDLFAGEPQEAQSSHAARALAARLADTAAGAIAFSRTGDPGTGDFEPAQVIARYGETPGEVE